MFLKLDMNFLIFALILVTVAFVIGAKHSYDGYKVFKVIPEDETTVSHLENLSWNGLGEFYEDNIEINKEARIIVSPDDLQNFLDFLKMSGIESEEMIPDIQRIIDQQLRPATSRASPNANITYFWNEYQNLRKIYDWLDELRQNYSEVVKIVDKGRSVLGRSIKGIVINYHPERKKKQIGILEGTLHARDWICTATLTWIINEFLTSTIPVVRKLARKFEWHIFPILNPDGYEYTFSDNRIWKKNRSPLNFTICSRGRDDMSKGVDLNRNFDFHWINVGTAKNPCSNSFAGPNPFSEPETRAVRDYVLKIDREGKLVYYVVFHSYGQLIVVPDSHVASDYSLLGGAYGEMFDIASRAAEALKKRHDTEYKVGLSSSVMYSMNGSSLDWVKNATNVSVALLFGLRDRGQYGFLLPADQIIPTAMEIMDALVEMDTATKKLGAIDEQMKPVSSRSSVSYLSYSWSEYHDLDRLYDWLDELQETHPNVVRTVIKGTSVLGKPIKGIILNYHPDRSEKLIGIIEGTLHAREWISTATVTWIIKEFLTSTDPAIRSMAVNLEWHIFPVLNPDGYDYTFTHNRMWRKNRSPASFTSCPGSDDNSNGVDLNRNFDFYWMGVGSSNDPCSNLYAGPSAFSEPEARAIRDYTLRVNQEGRLIYYLAFHSWGQMFVIPFSHVTPEQSLLSGNFANMFEISIRAVDALKQRYGTEYTAGLSASVLYPMTGTSFDWVKNVTNVPVSFLLELRDRGIYGFLLPPNQIIPTALETMDAMVEMDRMTRVLGYYQPSNSAVVLYSSFTIIVSSVILVMFK